MDNLFAHYCDSCKNKDICKYLDRVADISVTLEQALPSSVLAELPITITLNCNRKDTSGTFAKMRFDY